MFANKKLRRQDFRFENGWFETIVKKPKQLFMQQYQISDCEECNIFLFDSSACVYVDQCKFCNIFIGPSESSVFIRDCQHLNVVSISQQFRVRDSKSCKFAIFCQSQPIIESSYDLTFSCYPSQLSYNQLKFQLKQAKISEWNNNWFDIYDFTPQKYSQSLPNYKFCSFQKQIISLNQLFKSYLKQYKIVDNELSVIPSIEGKIKDIKTGKQFTLNDVVFLVFCPEIRSKSCKSLILQSKYLQVKDRNVFDCIGNLDEEEKNKKLLFLKIRKQDESRWLGTQNLIKIIKNDKEKESVQTVIFAPFQDEH